MLLVTSISCFTPSDPLALFPLSHPRPAAPSSSPASKIGLSAAALRQVVLYSSSDAATAVTLVSKEMRLAFSRCKDELVTRLLRQRSPRMEQVMKLFEGMATTGGRYQWRHYAAVPPHARM